MSWLELVERKAALEAIFGKCEPSIESIWLHEVSLHHEGPRARLRFDLTEYPQAPPSKWREAGYNTVQVTLLLVGVRQVAIQGWETANVGGLRLSSGSPVGISVEFVSASTTVSIVCDFVYLDKMSAYHDTARAAAPGA